MRPVSSSMDWTARPPWFSARTAGTCTPAARCNAICIFHRSLTTGYLLFEGFVQEGVDDVEALAVSPEGRHLLRPSCLTLRITASASMVEMPLPACFPQTRGRYKRARTAPPIRDAPTPSPLRQAAAIYAGSLHSFNPLKRLNRLTHVRAPAR